MKPIINLSKPKLRVLGYCSGSGNTLWKAYELQQQMETTFEGCPFEIVGIFADNPQSKSVATALSYSIPVESIDIREYYANLGKPLRDREVREAYDRAALNLIEKLNADVILLAGYVWAISDFVLDHYTVVNVHPADLAYTDSDHRRLLAGANGIMSAFSYNLPTLRSSSHIATKELDAGPLLIRSPEIKVDYDLHDNEEDRFRHYLRLVNEQNRLVGARTILELALGNFLIDDQGMLYYKSKPVPNGLTFDSWEKNIPYFQRNLNALLQPASVAVIGASTRPGIGNAIVQSIQRQTFQGELSVVNKKGDDVLGSKGYTSVLDIPHGVELAVIAVPSHSVLDVVRQCGQKGVSALICITAGFREIGGEGAVLEESLLEIVDEYNMLMVGPNCMGISNTRPDVQLNATILSNSPNSGNIAFLTQSGAIGTSIIDFSEELNLGFSIIVSLGNMAQMNPCDILPLLESDPNTKVICMYLETIPQPRRLESIMKKMTKPVIVVKSGRSLVGSHAASSHTGSLASNDKIVDAFFVKTGIIRVDHLEDAFLLASSISKTPLLKGNRVGIVSNTGGLGTLTADELTFQGFQLPQLDPSTKNALASRLFPEASTSNPIDLVAAAPPEHYEIAVRTLVESRLYDAIVINCVPPATVDTGKVAESIIKGLDDSRIPTFSCFFGPSLGASGNRVMRSHNIPTFSFPEQIPKTMKKMVRKNSVQSECTATDFSSYDRGRIQSIFDNQKKDEYLNPVDCFAVLDACGIPIVQSFYISFEDPQQSLELVYPVVAKIDHPEIVHKSDQNGIQMNIQNLKELSILKDRWMKEFPGARGIHVQQQVCGAIELIIGSIHDPNLGQSIMLGLGGTLVEIFKDISFGHVPITREVALDMIESLRSLPLLKGYRGKPGVDICQLQTILLHINQLLSDFPNIAEMDINPLIFDNRLNHFVAVDARIKR